MSVLEPTDICKLLARKRPLSRSEPILELSNVLVSAQRKLRTLAMTDIILKVSLVESEPIMQSLYPVAFPFACFEIADVLRPVSIGKRTLTVELAVSEFSNIPKYQPLPISQPFLPLSIRLSIFHFTDVVGSVGQGVGRLGG